MLKDTFGSFDSAIEKAIQLVTVAPADKSEMWNFTTAAYNVILPVAMTLAVLYFFVDFLNKSVMLEYMRWENVVKALFKLVVCKAILSNVQELTTGIFKIVSSLTTSLGNTAIVTNQIDYSAIKDSLGNPGFMECMALFVKILPITFLMWLVVKIIILIVYGRMIQIYIYTMFAPIPLANLAGEGFNGTAKNFIRDYAGVCLQGTVIIAAMGLYGAVVKDCLGAGNVTNIDGLGELFLISLVLIFILAKSGDWAKKIIGGH
uniref:TrbL/VirB6 plasmid conjugal transfer protein n=1 Tax=Clostridium botulinum TaxID=1491 RepID=A0A0A0UT94_CLOBO|nr:CD0415/CD1112 family protein [Clostridium botulinum]AIW54612.1 hypothetical protein [Clostridium botulinum]AIW54731.1 hypothetical protein [Clostridium botulinum]AIW54861.1 hypothetical protein [Clostridium botulinum]